MLRDPIDQLSVLGAEKLERLERVRRLGLSLEVGGSCASSSPESRLGGLPLLEPGVQWPRSCQSPHAFVAQLALRELCRQEEALTGPREGVLSFFYEVESDAWGFDPKDKDRFAVIYSPLEPEALEAARWPDDLPAEHRFDARLLEPTPWMYLPPWQSLLVEELGLSQEEGDAYFDAMEQEPESGGDLGIYLGHPNQIQGDMMWECSMVSRGTYCGDGKAYGTSQGEAMRATSSEWRLLFQAPSCEEIGMWWGDCGFLYFCIRDEDLQALRFERSWMVLQCT